MEMRVKFSKHGSRLIILEGLDLNLFDAIADCTRALCSPHMFVFVFEFVAEQCVHPTCVSAALLYDPIPTYQSRPGDRQTHPTFPSLPSFSSSFHRSTDILTKQTNTQKHREISPLICICIHPLVVFAMFPLRAQRNPPS